MHISSPPAILANLLGATAVGIGDRLDETGVRVTEMKGEGPAALLTVGTRPGRSIEHLRQTLGLSHSGTVRLVDRLEERGWIERRASGSGREVELRLTGAGRRLRRELLDARRRVLEHALGGLTAAESDRLRAALRTVLATLPDDRVDAWRICRSCEHEVCEGEACPVGSAVDRREAR